MTNTYVEGKVVRLTISIMDSDDAHVDPTTLTFKLQPKYGTMVTRTYGSSDSDVIKDATGIYHTDYTCSITSGYDIEKNHYSWLSTVPQGAAASGFNVMKRVPG